MAFSVSRAACLCTFVITLFSAPAAFAHAHLKAQTPAADSTVERAPQSLSLRFSEGIEPAFSGVKITGPEGKAVSTGKVARDANDERLLVVPLTQTLAPGDYQVEWHVVSVDSHKTKGQYRFTVK
ncbi:CopC domain-containing protein YobA [Franconibacter pulveris]|uniref:CopC domain-containing protein YobA n=1 Tax=Franconibacter pulveris TaxID=435910 RepID=UPI0004955F91|nr:CopC domain-containing protein YobA [Franconibacter pulveris]